MIEHYTSTFRIRGSNQTETLSKRRAKCDGCGCPSLRLSDDRVEVIDGRKHFIAGEQCPANWTRVVSPDGIVPEQHLCPACSDLMPVIEVNHGDHD